MPFSTVKKIDKNKELISKEEYDWRIREIVKCKKDIVYFAENYYKIVTLDEGLVQIKLYDVQKDLLKLMQKENRLVTLASRQSSKCVFPNTLITVRNKKTGKISKIPIEEFYNSLL